MDPLLLVPVLAAAALGVAGILWYRKRQVRQAGILLGQAASDLRDSVSALQGFTRTGDYIPERVRRPLEAKATELAERDLPPIVKVLRRSRDPAERDRLQEVVRHTDEFRKVLREHNEAYVQRRTAEHSSLLVDQLKADEAQQRAMVQDDERNLVIAGAGSGKTRTIVGRIRFLLERQVPANDILAVTFTNKATEEMQDRLKQMGVALADRGSEGVMISTLHALGKRVVQATLSGPVSVADDRWTDSLVAAALRDAREARDPQLAQLYINALLHFHRNEDERAPAVGGDQTYRSLRGQHVRSLGERIIADFLFIHHVPYKYEAKASWAQVSGGRGAYHPDFTLLESAAAIEYWGVNRQGQVPAGWKTSTAEYQQGMAWKREQFRLAGRLLLEFYDYERTEGTLEAALRERLTAAGIGLRLMTFEELQTALGDMKYIGSAIEKLLAQFIVNARELRRSPDEIREHLRGVSPRVHHFGLLGIAILERYEAALAAEERIDFSDMLHRAAEILEGGTNPLPKFQHILVDEFQDTSAAMARFLKALLGATGARLFAVGDDWQAIYGFAGGDLDYIVNFESYFGPASTTMLDVNYRSPAVIVEAGAALIAHNAKQVPKHVVVFRRERGEAHLHEAPDDDAAIVSTTLRLIQGELKRSKPDEVLVLSRTNHLLEDLIEACRRGGIPVANPGRSVPGVRILSAHKAKGLEANVVIVVNASDHLFGFPSKVENPDVLEPVRRSAGNAEAEERRLFYVAITRAIQRLHLVARRGLPSPYIAEIEGSSAALKTADPSHLPVGWQFSGSFYVEQLYPLSERQTAAGIRQSGVLATPTGRFAFTSWSSADLKEGDTYWLAGVIKDRPYRDQQRVRLDSRTSAELRTPSGIDASHDGTRELRPRPPPSHQPRRMGPREP